MDERYEKSIHRIGRVGILIGLVFMLGIPAVVSAVYDVWPDGVGEVFAVAAGLLAVFIPTNVAEVFGYTPMLGSSAYITFLTGNVTNLKIPVVVNAQTLTETAQGTDEGDTVATIGVAISSIVTTLVIVAGVILLVPLQPILTTPHGADRYHLHAAGPVRRTVLKLHQRRLRRVHRQEQISYPDCPHGPGAHRQPVLSPGGKRGLCGNRLHGAECHLRLRALQDRHHQDEPQAPQGRRQRGQAGCQNFRKIA